jgi:5'(3')-deoxyribonucleotidase
MKINRIVLDLDDVLNSCTMHLLHTLGCGVGPFDYHRYPVEVGYDMVGAWAKLSNRDVVTVPVFWEWISRRTWEMMPKSDQFWLLDAAADLVGRENVLIATAPTKSPDCLFGKYQWIEQHVPSWCKRQYSVTPRKEWLAQPGYLLIDDCDKNVESFINPPDGRPGGDAILCPRPWNSKHELFLNVNEYLSRELGDREYV